MFHPELQTLYIIRKSISFTTALAILFPSICVYCAYTNSKHYISLESLFPSLQHWLFYFHLYVYIVPIRVYFFFVYSD